jgi:hypothetical protein
MVIDLLAAAALLVRAAVYLRVRQTGRPQGQARPEHALVTGLGSAAAAVVFVVAAVLPGNHLWIELTGLAIMVGTTRFPRRTADEA